jgi:hypothetical protein
VNTFNFKTLFVIILQVLGAMLAFVVSLIVANMLLPLSPEISAAGQTATGFLAPPLAFLFNAFVNGVILVWAARSLQFQRHGAVRATARALLWRTSLYDPDRNRLLPVRLPAAARQLPTLQSGAARACHLAAVLPSW